MTIISKLHKNIINPSPQVLLWMVLSCFIVGVFWTKPSIPRFAIEVTGFLLILLLLVMTRIVQPILLTVRLFILISVCSISLYLLPLPISLWMQLPGRDFYHHVIQLLEQIDNPIAMHTISLDTYETVQTLLALLPSLAVFLGTINLQRQQLYWLIWVFLAAACFQSIWGIIQYATIGMAQGSYTNRNHFAALMGLALPIAIGLLVQHILHNNIRERLQALRRFLYILAITLIFLGGLLSTSRAGTAGLFLGLLASLLVFSSRLGAKPMIAGISFLLALSGILIANVDMTPVLDRFLALDPRTDPRWVMFIQTIEGVKTFFPLGSGPGTFADTYAAFQPEEKIGWAFIKHAHNDYLELVFETGVIGIGIIVGFLGIFLHGLIRLRQQAQDELFYLKTGAAIGIITALFHALFDFNFHTPAYPVFFALLAGIFFVQTSHIQK